MEADIALLFTVTSMSFTSINLLVCMCVCGGGAYAHLHTSPQLTLWYVPCYVLEYKGDRTTLCACPVGLISK